MDNLIKFVIPILTERGISRKELVDKIARGLIKCIIYGDKPLGQPFYSQKQLAKVLNASNRTFQEVWHRLIVIYKIITVCGKVNTKVVDYITDDDRARLQIMVERPTFGEFSNFDQHSLYGFTVNSRSFMSTFANKALGSYDSIKPALSSKTFWPQFHEMFAELGAERLGYKVPKSMVYYSRGHKELLSYVAECTLADKRLFVCLSPAAANINQALRLVKQEAVSLKATALTARLNELEQICLSSPVGVIYLSPANPYAEDDALFNSMWQRVQELQHKYHFTILLDDPLGKLERNYQYFKSLPAEQKANLIYLGPLSTVHPETELVNFIIAPEATINSIKKKNNRQAQITLGMANALYELYISGALKKSSNRTHREAQIRRKLAVDKLTECGKFNVDFLLEQKDWILYLEPVAGTSYVDQIYKELQMFGIFILSTDVYCNNAKYSSGIWISISGFRSDENFAEHLDKLLYILDFLIRSGD